MSVNLFFYNLTPNQSCLMLSHMTGYGSPVLFTQKWRAFWNLQSKFLIRLKRLGCCLKGKALSLCAGPIVSFCQRRMGLAVPLLEIQWSAFISKQLDAQIKAVWHFLLIFTVLSQMFSIYYHIIWMYKWQDGLACRRGHSESAASVQPPSSASSPPTLCPLPRTYCNKGQAINGPAHVCWLLKKKGRRRRRKNIFLWWCWL